MRAYYYSLVRTQQCVERVFLSLDNKKLDFRHPLLAHLTEAFFKWLIVTTNKLKDNVRSKEGHSW